MKIIEKMNAIIEESLGYQTYHLFEKYILSPYLLFTTIADGILVYNSMTGEIILLLDKENIFDSSLKDWLVKHWFFILESSDCKTIADMTRHVYLTKCKKYKKNKKESVVVMTTTNCNARCYYCYESGCVQRNMSDKTAKDVANYIVQNYSNGINISWFGGEPLCNPRAMDIIIEHLIKTGVPYSSSMVSNGYLLNEHSPKTIIDFWKLRNIQVTLDGTKDVYQYSKNYKNEDPNAFERVLDNIEMLLKNNIIVNIRLNVSLTNCEDMLRLISCLSDRFKKYDNFSVYASPLFIGLGNPPLILTKEEGDILYDNVRQVFECLSKHGLYTNREQLSSFKTCHCMADSDKCCVITPDGSLSSCEHHFDNKICGNIYDGIIDKEMMNSWKQTGKIYDECRLCFNYPKCIKIKQCPTESMCDEARRKLMTYKIELKVIEIYENYKNKIKEIKQV